MFKLYWKDELIAEQTMADNPFLSKMVALPDAPQVKLPFIYLDRIEGLFP